MMKKQKIFSVICTVIFLLGSVFVFRQGRGTVDESMASYFIDIGFQLVVGGAFLMSWLLLKNRSAGALNVFRMSCLAAVLYVVVRCVEVVINARLAGLDDIPTIPIVAITGTLLAAIFFYFFIASGKSGAAHD